VGWFISVLTSQPSKMPEEPDLFFTFSRISGGGGAWLLWY
jgi:hypothetical protein